MNLLGPQFIDITWGAGGTTSDLSLEMANNIQKQLGVDTCLHLTCTNMTIDKLDETLEVSH
jgi:methylenetetrahydrofolate reductase (NADPH)